ncbi:MAG: tryptophan 7-halogenase [Burkholderiaceae bacterium]|nr:tryptophan 7-halogenase [Burkholderiaceae bacterium]
MQQQALRNIVIVGGGTAGWMAAAVMAELLHGPWNITLVESEEIGIVGVGEATIPYLKNFHAELGIDEDEFMRATQATFKLGIEFVNWGRQGDSYIHGFGPLGQDVGTTKFHLYWLQQYLQGKAAGIEDYSINLAAARANKFIRARTDMPDSPLGKIAHAFHFDAGLYAKFLRGFAEKLGVKRIEGKIRGATQRADDGFIDAVVLDSGQRIEGDFFIDCSGFRGLLIEQTLHSGYEDWSHWLPCDSAQAVPCESVAPLLPYTRSTARSAGWQWRIPLQHRMGNGHVYCSRFISDDEAGRTLMANLDGKALAGPRQLRFVTGKRKKLWNKNVVAVGLASGFMEPLESTSIHLIQTTLMRLASFFPDRGYDAADVDEFNRQADVEFERIRDFLILHYKATERSDSEFWNYCRTMPVPDALQHKMDLFRSKGRIFRDTTDLFSEVSWFSVMFGQRLRPRGHHPLLDAVGDDKIAAFLANTRHITRKCVDAMPLHADYIAGTCRAPTM